MLKHFNQNLTSFMGGKIQKSYETQEELEGQFTENYEKDQPDNHEWHPSK